MYFNYVFIFVNPERSLDKCIMWVCLSIMWNSLLQPITLFRDLQSANTFIFGGSYSSNTGYLDTLNCCFQWASSNLCWMLLRRDMICYLSIMRKHAGNSRLDSLETIILSVKLYWISNLFRRVNRYFLLNM